MINRRSLLAGATAGATALKVVSKEDLATAGDGLKQLAASLAGSISQRNLQQASLQEQIAQNARANALKEKEIAGLAAYRQAASDPALIKYAERYMRENPGMNFDQAMEKASRAAGYSFRTEGLMGGKLAAELRKIDEDFNMIPYLKAGNPEGKHLKFLEEERQRRRNEAYRLYGGDQSGGGKSSSLDLSQWGTPTKQ